MDPIRIANTKLSVTPTERFNKNTISSVLGSILTDEKQIELYRRNPASLFNDVGLDLRHDDADISNVEAMRAEIASASFSKPHGEQQASIAMVVIAIGTVAYS